MTKFLRTVFIDKYSCVKSEPTYTNQLINIHYIQKICPVDNYPNLLQIFLIDQHQELHYVFAKDVKNALREIDEHGCTLIQKIQNEYDGQTESYTWLTFFEKQKCQLECRTSTRKSHFYDIFDKMS